MSLSSSTKKQRAITAVSALQTTPSLSGQQIKRRTPKTRLSHLPSARLSLHSLPLPPQIPSTVTQPPGHQVNKTTTSSSQSSKSNRNLLPNYSFIKQNLEFDQITEDYDYTYIRQLFHNDEVDKLFFYLQKKPHVAAEIHKIRNRQGESILTSAVKEKIINITTLLVQLTKNLFSLKGSLLVAIELDHYEVILIILKRIQILKTENNVDVRTDIPCVSNKGVWKGECADFPPYLTPIMLACEKENFVTIKILLKHGCYLENVHEVGCKCLACNSGKGYNLTETIGRYRALKGLTCPAYICLTQVDPVLRAFRLKKILDANAETEPELADQYLELSDRCSRFVSEFLDLCVTKEEVMVLLSHEAELKNKFSRPFNRVGQALAIDCIDFVSHNYCQQVLSSVWYKENEWLISSGSIKIAFYFFIRTICLPVMGLVFVFAPYSKYTERQSSPSNRYLNDAASFTIFSMLTLGLALWTTYEQERAPRNSISLYVLILFIIGMWVKKLNLIMQRGRHAYLINFWNTYDLVMLVFYTITFLAWSLAASEVRGEPASISIPREYWPSYEPRLVAEASFIVALLMCFGRLMSFIQLSKSLGPLQLCIVRMIINTLPFLVILAVVWIAFSVCLYIIFGYYSTMKGENSEGEKIQNTAFMSLTRSLHTVYLLFMELREEEYDHIILPNIKFYVGKEKIVLKNSHQLTQNAGLILVGLFHLVGSILLLNMLIAIMTEAYTNISARAIHEFKVSRTKVWLGYFYADKHLPIPFNLVPRLAPIVEHYLLNQTQNQAVKKQKHHVTSADEAYQKLMTTLTRRYFKRHYRSQLEKEGNLELLADF